MSSFKAENIIRKNLAAEELVLSGLHLTSIDALLPLLATMPRLRRLNLADNDLTALPSDCTALGRVEVLDLSRNPFPGAAPIISGLQTAPQLRRLTVDLPHKIDDEELIVGLPSLQWLNGARLIESIDASSAPATVHGSQQSTPSKARSDGMAYWGDRESEGVERLFADVRCDQSNASVAEFGDYMNRVVQHVTCLTAAEDDPLAQEGEVLKARRLLYDYCFGEVVRCAFNSGQDALGAKLQSLLKYNCTIMDQYDSHWRRILRDRDLRLAHMKQNVQEAMSEIETFIARSATAEAGKIADSVEIANATSFSSSNATPKRWVRTDTPLAGSAGLSPQPLRPSPYPGLRSSCQQQQQQRPSTASSSRPKSSTKVLSLRQLKDAIEDIYTSKSKYDAKCRQNHLPRETMEQHMYTYLNQRYGLREIILEWAIAIVEGVRRYATEDNDVAVFGKVLRNEVDEEFRFVQQRIRETVKELLRLQIKTRRPGSTVSEVEAALQHTLRHTVIEEDWRSVVQYMYNTSDAAQIKSIIHQFLYTQSLPQLRRQASQPEKRQQRRGTTAPSGTPLVRVQLLYSDFVRLLLDFQLSGHEQFLEPYVAIFCRHDGDRNGIVNGAEFAAIVRELDPTKSEEEVESMVTQIDPLNSELITFSDSVSFLNDELLSLVASHS